MTHDLLTKQLAVPKLLARLLAKTSGGPPANSSLPATGAGCAHSPISPIRKTNQHTRRIRSYSYPIRFFLGVGGGGLIPSSRIKRWIAATVSYEGLKLPGRCPSAISSGVQP